MALLSINEEELDRFIAKRVREGVREELAKRGKIIDQKMFSRKDAYHYLGISGSYFDSAVKRDLSIRACRVTAEQDITCAKIWIGSRKTEKTI